jgi:Holliday junction resolvase
MIRRAAKVDANHREIAAALIRCGAWVVDCSAVGQGFPDLLVSHRGKLTLVEIKDGAKSPSRRKLTPAQVDFHALAKAAGTPVRVVETVEQAIALVAV